MTDKVQKIKEWISKTQDGLMDANGNFEHPEHEGAYNILCNLDTYIDSMQKECNITGIKSKHATGKLKECIDNISEEGLEQARKQLEENPQECMYSKDNYTDEDRKALCDGCEEECRFNKKEEPVSEDLKEEISKFFKDWGTDEINGGQYGINLDIRELKDIAHHFAKWQEEQDKQVLNEEGVIVLPEEVFERMKRSLIELTEKEQQLMTKAVDVTIAIPYQNGDGDYTQLVYSKEALPFGENLKVLVINKG